MKLCFLLVAVGLLGVVTCDDVEQEVVDVPNVVTEEGELRGKLLRSYSGRPIFAYLGIPYAKPPLGELRFQHPRRPEHWTGVRDATKDGPKCAQLIYPERTYEGDENCLFLNVYTTKVSHAVRDMDVFTLNDVVVILHDGGFSHGSGDSSTYLPDHLLEHDITLVSFNYRLGALGFLSTGDEFAAGNYGLKDQVEALHWVHRNIIEFGGNPLSVTLLGTQAGGSAAHLHTISPLSRDRFHGAISLSGTALSPWGVVDTAVAKQRAMKLGSVVGCTKKELKSSELLIKCLRNKYTLDLVKGAPKTVEWATDFTYPFVPVVEPVVYNRRPFLPLHPEPLMVQVAGSKQGRHAKSWLVGVAANEALPHALQVMIFPYIINSLNANPEKYVPLFLGLEVADEAKRKTVGRLIWDFYMRNETIVYGNMNQLEEMVTDFNVFHGVYRSVSLMAKSEESPVYAYRFSFDRRSQLMSLGVPQGDDMEYVFPNVVAGVKRKYEEKERPTIETLTQIIANFAKHGDPTPEGSDLLGDKGLWPQASGESFEFVDIGNKLTIEEGFYPERVQFWDEIEQFLKETTKHDEL